MDTMLQCVADYQDYKDYKLFVDGELVFSIVTKEEKDLSNRVSIYSFDADLDFEGCSKVIACLKEIATRRNLEGFNIILDEDTKELVELLVPTVEGVNFIHLEDIEKFCEKHNTITLDLVQM